MKPVETLKVKNRAIFSCFIISFIFALFLAGSILPASASGIEANREISAGMVYAGETFTVTVHIRTDQYIEAPTLNENLPDGWTVSRIENGGATFQDIETFKESTMEWIWVESLQAGEEKTITYRVTVPPATKPGNFTISGNVSAYSVPAVPVTGATEIAAIYPPKADFSANPLSGTAPLAVQFTDSSTGNQNSWEWDFDANGSVDSSEKNPIWTYETPGVYTVTLRASSVTSGAVTETKTDYITVAEKTSPSGENSENNGSDENCENSGTGGSSGNTGTGGTDGSSVNTGGSSVGGGGGGGSPESSRNVELKEISNSQVFKGIHTCYTFKGKTNEIVTIEFDPRKNFGKTTAIVEILKGTSSTVKEPAPGTVYRNLNIWVGNSGFSNPENFENARISFRVSQEWLSENDIDENTIALYRYSEDTWTALPTTRTGEDEEFFYFTAETPGFSPFAIASPEKNTEIIKITPIRDREYNLVNSGGLSGEESEGGPERERNTASDKEKSEKRNALISGISFSAVGLLGAYAAVKGRKRNNM